MNQIHLNVVDFFFDCDSKRLHIEKFSRRWDKFHRDFSKKFWVEGTVLIMYEGTVAFIDHGPWFMIFEYLHYKIYISKNFELNYALNFLSSSCGNEFI